MTYAQITEQGYCVGVSQLSDEVKHDDMILLDNYDTSYIGRKYDRQNKIWTDEYLENEEVVQEPLTPIEALGQQLSDLEIQQLEYNMQATQEREFLGQQLSDLEISILERGL